MTASTETSPKKKRNRSPAPWRSRTIRVPVELHPQVAELSRAYKAAALAAAREKARP